MARRSTFAATTVGKSSWARQPVRNRRANLDAAVDSTRPKDVATAVRNEFADMLFAEAKMIKSTNQRNSYENEQLNHHCHHSGDTITMDTAGSDDVGPRHCRPRHNRLPPLSALHPELHRA
jgi:hypothetical protein